MRSMHGHMAGLRALPRSLIFSVALVSLHLAGCSDSGVTEARPHLKVGAEKIVFPTTYVGYPTVQELRIVNGGRAEGRFTVTPVEAPFQVEPTGSRRIGGSSEEVLKIRFSPPTAGTFADELVLELQDEPVRIGLVGEAEFPPSCHSTPCTRAEFDPRLGECVVEHLPDGAACESENQCLVDTFCRDGICQGSARTCEPKNACFQAMCNPATGCEQIVSDPCPPPENPCKEARCNLETGDCVVQDREDFSPCGPMNCEEWNVCIGGSCTRIAPAPDDSPCSHACGPNGRCSNGECLRPEGPVLVESWKRDLNGLNAEFNAAVDGKGYLYWLECPPSEGEGCSVVSATPNGFERFRRSIFQEVRAVPKLFLTDDGVYVSTRLALVAMDASGDPRWDRMAEDLAEEAGLGCPCEADLLDVVDAGEKTLVALVRWTGGSGLLGISARDGGAEWFFPFEGSVSGPLVSDGEGRIYTVEPGEATALLRAHRARGDVDWELEVELGTRVLAALPSRVFLWRQGALDVRSAPSGAPSWSRAADPVSLVLSNRYAFVMERPGPRLVVLDVEDGEELGSRSLEAASGTSTLALRAEDRAVLLSMREDPADGWWLEEYDADGQRTYACQLPDFSFGGAWAFVPPADGEDARLVVSSTDRWIRTFLAPRLAPPPYGWSAERGSFGRAGRPRQ